MRLTVTVATARLRLGLLELLAKKSKAIESPCEPRGSRDVDLTRAHYAKAKAAADLLDAIGWQPSDLSPPYELDIARHGWAATAALRLLIRREERAALEYAADFEAEAAGEAGGHRLNAKRELSLIEAACERACLTITEPEP